MSTNWRASAYLKNPFAPLCGLRGLNLTAEDAKKRKENLAMELPIFVFEMASGANRSSHHRSREQKTHQESLMGFCGLLLVSRLADTLTKWLSQGRDAFERENWSCRTMHTPKSPLSHTQVSAQRGL
jgi:hypothetical protein